MFYPGRLVLVSLLAASCSTQPGGGGGGTGGRSDAAASGGSGGFVPASGGSGGTAVDSSTRDDTAALPDVMQDQAAAADQGGGAADGATDTNGSDGGGEGGVTAMCPPNALLCDDFEKYAAGGNLGPTWTTDLIGGTVRVDATRPFQGKQAVHITTATGVSNMLQIVAQGAPLFPLAGNMFYGRMMFWLSQVPPDHFNILQASGMLAGSTQVAKYAYGAKYSKLMAGYTIRNRETDAPFVDCGNKPAPTGYPEKQWLCVEWQFDGAKDEMHYWLNGQPQTAVDVIKTGGCSEGGAAPADGRWRAPVFNKVMLGFYAHPFNTPIDVWIDDVVISTQPIGCPKAP